jgi:outer membrane protein insertion porin family
VYLLSFLDAGNSWGNFDNFNPFETYRGTGLGVRIFLPMFGLLGLDWGYRLDDVPGRTNMQRSQIHFTIGANLGEL